MIMFFLFGDRSDFNIFIDILSIASSNIYPIYIQFNLHSDQNYQTPCIIFFSIKYF